MNENNPTKQLKKKGATAETLTPIGASLDACRVRLVSFLLVYTFQW